MNLNNVALTMTEGLPERLAAAFSDGLPQIALCGRSNVGKSSLINTLLGRKKLARVSSEPGKTITVNAYLVDNTVYLVDLPGYGYAKRSFAERNKWQTLINAYFSTPGDKLYLQLVDLKVGLTKDDEVMVRYLLECELPFAVVATKCDKLNKTDRQKALDALQNDPRIPSDTAILPFSSLKGEGKEDVWEILTEFVNFVNGEASETL